MLMKALDRLDDLWTGVYLGKTALGYYSRAYTFATYPRRVLAAPLNEVTRGTYAELKGDRQGLSQTFFRVNALLVRSGFFLGGLLYLVAPEFIRLFLAKNGCPCSCLPPDVGVRIARSIKITVSYVLRRWEERVVRRVQFNCLSRCGLYLLGPRLGITGVAVAVDLMLVVGIILLLRMARQYADFSVRRLFLVPALALALALLLGLGTTQLPGLVGNDWMLGLVKASVFSVVYGGLWLALERSEAVTMLKMLTGRLTKGTAPRPQDAVESVPPAPAEGDSSFPALGS
jgi:hypothetical protein